MAYYYYELEDFEKYITYLDSAIVFGKQAKYIHYPASFYVNKGTFYDEKGMFELALDNYIKGLVWVQKRNDPDYKAIIEHNIALLKRKIGKYEEAKSLFKKALAYESSKKWETVYDSLSYLVTLSDLIDTYRKNQEIESALVLNNKGMKLSEGKDIQNIFPLAGASLQLVPLLNSFRYP